MDEMNSFNVRILLMPFILFSGLISIFLLSSQWILLYWSYDSLKVSFICQQVSFNGTDKWGKIYGEMENYNIFGFFQFVKRVFYSLQ